MRIGSDIYSSVGDCKGSQRRLTHRILSDHLILSGRLNDGGIALFAREVDVSIVQDRRGGVISANTLLPNRFAARRVEARADTTV